MRGRSRTRAGGGRRPRSDGDTPLTIRDRHRHQVPSAAFPLSRVRVSWTSYARTIADTSRWRTTSEIGRRHAADDSRPPPPSGTVGGVPIVAGPRVVDVVCADDRGHEPVADDVRDRTATRR